MAVEMFFSNVVREEAAGGRAALAVPCVVGGAGRRAMCETAVSYSLRTHSRSSRVL